MAFSPDAARERRQRMPKSGKDHISFQLIAAITPADVCAGFCEAVCKITTWPLYLINEDARF
jgi:hypothetical protein